MRFAKGQTLIEVIVVITIGILIIGALVFATIAGLRNAQFAKNQAQATKLAQEGIERVRTGRDRNKSINGNLATVTSWNGDTLGNGKIWDYQLSGSGNCGDQNVAPKVYCYFKLTDTEGTLTYMLSFQPTAASPLPPSSAVESILPFTRSVILSDDSTTFSIQKTVTVIVGWTDFSGYHESKLITILRSI